MKYPRVSLSSYKMWFTVEYSEELTDYEVMELFKKVGSCTVLDYDELDNDGVITHLWKVEVEDCR